MADLSTFQKYKDWFTAMVVALLITILATVASNNRQNIAENKAANDARFAKIERRLEYYEDIRQQGFERLKEAETNIKDLKDEVDRLRDRQRSQEQRNGGK